MTEREAFVAAIAASPDEDTPRLAFADWLQEHGEDDRAHYIRLLHELNTRRSGAESWDDPPAEVRELERRARALFERHAGEWLRPFCRALGTTVPPVRERWSARLWRRITRRPQRPDPLRHFEFGFINFEAWDDGPVGDLALYRGFVGSVQVRLGSRRPVGDPATAFGLEPVTDLTVTVADRPAAWERLNRPCLSRVARLTIDLSDENGVPPFDVYERVLRGPHWAGVSDLHLWRNIVDFQPAPAGYIERLAESPLLPGVRSLSLMIEQPNLVPLTANPRLAGVERFAAWGCRLPPEAAAAIADARFAANLEELDLSSNNLGDDGAALLAAGAWPKLSALDLGCNDLTDAGAAALVPLTGRLRSLSIAGGQITDAGARRLADALNPDTLESFWLSYNPLSAKMVAELRERFGDRFHFTAREDAGELQQTP
jgi:uncharacterized protein (TIGR02996 family)